MNARPSSNWNRREFLALTAAAGAGFAWAKPGPACGAGPEDPAVFTRALLRDWCDALLRLQIDDPARPDRHGAFKCPACADLHGRCGDAVYPLLHLAHVTGERRYLDGALRVVEWMKNVDAPDGAWTNDVDPKSWKGTTVFAAIALGEAIERHGTLLDAATRERWLARLKRAADFIHANFTITYGNVNYGMTGTYALALLGRLFQEDRYLMRSRELAREATAFFTEPNALLYGEGKPATGRSPRGLRPVDLGYNVEESLPSLASFGLLEKNEEILALATRSLAAHLEFMLPDGAWDNSWGTRSFKWTYWGSRTSDGSAPAFIALADRHPAFAAAALRNLQLLRACTKDGLLYGGPHYAARGIPPCVHHTFCHAKALAAVLDHRPDLAAIKTDVPLPRESAAGVRTFPEVEVALVAKGPWRATVTAYDWVYGGKVCPPSGGALSMLWHKDVGPLCSGSLTRYVLQEAHNMQTLPEGTPDFPLTPRAELRIGDRWFTTVYDRSAKVAHGVDADVIAFDVEARLVDEMQKPPDGIAPACRIGYRFTDAEFAMTLTASAAGETRPDLVVPIVSATGESVRRISGTRFEIVKPGGTVVVESNGVLAVAETGRERVFNFVPGFEAVPFVFKAPADGRPTGCRVTVRPRT